MTQLISHINNKGLDGLPAIEIPPDQESIAGGFFIAHNTKIQDWQDQYNAKLSAYFEAGYLVKDDQIILADIIFSNMKDFTLYRENIIGQDNWFMFQRLIL